MTYTMARFGGREPIIGEDVGKMEKELLHRRRSVKEEAWRKAG